MKFPKYTIANHAKLAVNFSMAMSDFLLESWEYQHSK